MLNMSSTVRIYARTVLQILRLIHFLVGILNIKKCRNLIHKDVADRDL